MLELRPDHRALYIVTAEGRKPFSKPPTLEEYRDKFITMSVFAGTYELVGDKITFHVEVGQFPDWLGTDIRRTLDLQGNVLHYATTPIRISAPNGKTEEAIFTLRSWTRKERLMTVPRPAFGVVKCDEVI